MLLNFLRKLSSWKTETYPNEINTLNDFKSRISSGESLKIEYLSGTLSSGGVNGCDIEDCRKLRDKLKNRLKKTSEERYGSVNVIHSGCTQMDWRVKKWRFGWPDNRRKCASYSSPKVYCVVKV